jgi:hypothetical protein
MTQGLERRLILLERQYQTAQKSEREINIGWLTADDHKRGRLPGLYLQSPDDGDSPVVPAAVDD